MFSFVFDGSVPAGHLFLLTVALAIALGFEFVNGFHDTANAVATVIYTRTLAPRTAVIWSGCCNFLGVCLGGTAVAFTIVNLLPVDLLIAIGSRAGMAMVFALLISAIVWNLGTWYFGMPVSSSHTLIGGIVGVGLTNSIIRGDGLGRGVDWTKVGEVGLSLLVSPCLGFFLAAVVLILFRAMFRDPALFDPASPQAPPPRWIRGILILTCSGVSLAHGSNDGQKGVGLIMLILIGLLPAHYALNPNFGPAEIARMATAIERLEAALPSPGAPDVGTNAATSMRTLSMKLHDLKSVIGDVTYFDALPLETRWRLRSDVLVVVKTVGRLREAGAIPRDHPRGDTIRESVATLEALAEYAPRWVLLAVAVSLGLGTTVGWKRIVETVGEKIGKTHLSYAQGASAELVAMVTIGLADVAGLPVSTTHVLSSGIAGTMAANGSGIQGRTVRNILLAWILTLPASMLLAGSLYALFRLAAA